MLHRAAWQAGLLGALNAMAMVLSARLTVLVAVCGGIGLTWYYGQQLDAYRLGALGIYAIGVVAPTVWLAAMGR
jgi:hypothetical protein